MELVEIEALVGELELRVDRLRALYDQYFMGIEKLEPMVPRKDVERRLHVLRKEQIRNTAVRFKFQTIIQRYNTYQTYWMRICRQIEEGTYRRDVMRANRRFGSEKRASDRPPARASRLEETRAHSGEEKGAAPATEPPDGDDALSIDVDFEAVTEDPFPMPPLSQRPAHPIAESRPRTMRIAPLASKLPPSLLPSFTGSRAAVDGASPGAGEPPLPAGLSRPGAARAREPGADVTAAEAQASLEADLARRISIPPRPRLPSVTGEEPKIVVARRSATIVPAGGVSIAPPRGATLMPGGAPAPSLLPPGAPLDAPIAPIAPIAPPAPRLPAPSVPAISSPPDGAVSGGLRVSPSLVAPASITPAPVASPRASLGPRAPATPSRAPSAPGDIAEDRVRQLYSQYIETKRKHNESTAAITYEGLAASLRQSSAKLRDKHGRGKSVDFEVIVKDGKTILRPIVK